jgi:hypothetical protein
MRLPIFSHFMKSPSGAAKTSARLVEIGNLSIWFSYRIPIAFQIGGQPRVISQNVWGGGVGIHLNGIDRDKSKRIPHEEFEQRLSAVVEALDRTLERVEG